MAEWPKVSDLEKREDLVWSKKQRWILRGGEHYKGKIGDTGAQIVSKEWYRGDHLNFFPMKPNLDEGNATYDYFLKGWVPDSPFIDQDSNVTAFGSCFAHEIRTYLTANGYKSYDPTVSKFVPIIHVPEGINTTFALVQQFEWAWGNASISDGYWYDRDKKKFEPTEAARQATKEIFDNTDVFILTLGLSEIWYDKLTNDVFWRGVPLDKFDPERHGFRVSTVTENVRNLEMIRGYIKKFNPNAHLILTLSPVPLTATFRNVPCTSANMVSKATLRVAVDELMRNHEDDDHLWYWPSYELVKERWNQYDADNRHVSRETINMILETFSQYYLKG